MLNNYIEEALYDDDDRILYLDRSVNQIGPINPIVFYTPTHQVPTPQQVEETQTQEKIDDSNLEKAKNCDNHDEQVMLIKRYELALERFVKNWI